MAQQKRYDAEFKVNTVQLILEKGKPVTQVSRELGIAAKTLYAWVTQFKSDPTNAFVGSGHLKPDDQALRDMQKRIRDLEEENAILKKAMRIFTKDRK